jgi:hypothetical protein
VRELDDPFREGLHEAFRAGEMLTVDLLYGDHEGGQRTISRFILTNEDDDQWRCGVVRHWALDGIDPRVTGPMRANTGECLTRSGRSGSRRRLGRCPRPRLDQGPG